MSSAYPNEGGAAAPHSKTSRNYGGSRIRGSVLECGSPLPLWLFVLTLFLGETLAYPANFRAHPLNVIGRSKPGFTLLAPVATGINFTNTLSLERQLRSHVLLNGSGVALGDVDGDDWCDIYFCGLDGPNVLYRNLGGWKFQDVTATTGVACTNLDATGAVFADLDGDSDLDLIVNSTGGGTLIFLNNGKGHFENTAVLNAGRGGTSTALADIDGNGTLDIYIANYRTTMLVDMPQTHFRFGQVDGKKVIVSVNGRPITDPELVDRFVVSPTGGIDELGEADVLYLNRGGTNFTLLPFTEGAFVEEQGRPLAQRPLDWGLSVIFRDINGDNLPDIYVCNDFDSPDRLWLNQGNGRFQAAPPVTLRKQSLFSMGVDFADINRDGYDDFFVIDMLSRDHVRRLTQMPDRKPPIPVIGKFDDWPQYTMNTLFLNRRDGTYTEIAQLAGVAASEWSWATVFLDVDLDGWEDILVANGHARDARNMDILDQLATMREQKKMSAEEVLQARRIFPSLALANLAFHNQRDLTFRETGAQWGFDTVTVSHGMAIADLDNDGDLDVVINNLNGLAGIYRNETDARRVAVRLKGQSPNTAGIGAKVKLSGGPVTQMQEMISGGRYLSSDDPIRTFAAGNTTNNLTLEVTWRSGAVTTVTNVRPNHLYEIMERGQPVPAPIDKSTTPPLFEDVSHLLNHTHHDEPFNDFAQQPLLVRKLSQLGPGVSWADVNGDGHDDLIIGTGKGGRMAIYENNGKGGFNPRQNGSEIAQQDQTTILAAGHRQIFIGLASYEDANPTSPCVKLLNSPLTFPGHSSSVGPMTLGDYDLDGDLDLFVGGRVMPRKYPAAASSLLFRNTGTNFVLDPESTKLFEGIGLVSGAVFADLDTNGTPDLILACEWGPLKIFRNNNGRLVPANPEISISHQPSTINQLTGWWNGVTVADFDGDGRLDIVASNWGRNTPYESHRWGETPSSPDLRQPHSLQVFHGDLDSDGTYDLIEAHYDPKLKMNVSERMASFVGHGLPLLGRHFQTYESFARASIEEVSARAAGRPYERGAPLVGVQALACSWLESTVFLNRGEQFDVRVLPVEAQMAPAFGVCAADFDGDGREDIFLSQNFYATQPSTPRYDGGRGLLLRGDGRGSFTAMPGQEGGIKIYGEQRGAAVADYDADGRIDLVVTQNGAQTKLYRNMAAKTGLRVRLSGPAENPQAIGAMLRLTSDLPVRRATTPARYIHAGAGYWSQDSAVQVLPVVGLDHLQIRWPGGQTSVVRIPPGAREIAINRAGEVAATR